MGREGEGSRERGGGKRGERGREEGIERGREARREGEGSRDRGGGKRGERGREAGIGYPPVHPHYIAIPVQCWLNESSIQGSEYYLCIRHKCGNLPTMSEGR